MNVSTMSELQEFLTSKLAKQNLEFATDRDLWKAEAERMTSGYDQAQVELAALREELAVAQALQRTAEATLEELREDFRACRYGQKIAISGIGLVNERLTAAEQRNATLLETAQGLTIQLHAAIGNTEHHEDCIRDLAELQPTESGASE